MSKKYSPRSKLIERRKEVGLTQAQLARKLCITRAAYANYETGYRNPSLENVVKIKNILEVVDDDIFFTDKERGKMKLRLKGENNSGENNN